MFTVFLYDGTFAGFLTALFDVYDRKAKDCRIVKESSYQPDPFAEEIKVITAREKALRVWKGLEAKLTASELHNIYSCWLSELKEIDDVLLEFIRYVFSSSISITGDYGNKAVLNISQTAKKVWREKHRMEAFVRFQKLGDGLFYATIEPDFNVLPLIVPHFRNRYADQRWLIYDVKRKYGIYYDLEKVEEVLISFNEGMNVEGASMFDEKEELYQLLWKDYFRSANIPARKNMKLHLQHVPARYWKYLTEKT